MQNESYIKAQVKRVFYQSEHTFSGIALLCRAIINANLAVNQEVKIMLKGCLNFPRLTGSWDTITQSLGKATLTVRQEPSKCKKQGSRKGASGNSS
jgi:hypothetical protein